MQFQFLNLKMFFEIYIKLNTNALIFFYKLSVNKKKEQQQQFFKQSEHLFKIFQFLGLSSSYIILAELEQISLFVIQLQYNNYNKLIKNMHEEPKGEIKGQKQVLLEVQQIKQKSQLSNLEEAIKQNRQIIKKSKKAFVGTGFSFDLTEFFKFKKRTQIQPGGSIGTIFYEVSGSGISWLVLWFSVVIASCIPTWIIALKLNNLVALFWRFFFQIILMIPFVLHEMRTIKFQDSHKYTFGHIFNHQHLKKLYLCSFATVFWYTVILTAGEWTYLSHAFYLGSLTNFFLSLYRHKHRNVHEFEVGGQVIVIIGICFVILDTATFRDYEVQPEEWTYKNYYYLTRTKNQRIIADVIALITSLVMSRFSQMNSKVTNIFPPFLSMLIIDFMNAINLLFVAYFFNGATFDNATIFGIFSIFSDNEFALFLYTAIVLCVGLVISFVLVARLFPNFVCPSIAYLFQPGFSTIILSFTKMQHPPGSFSLIGYTIMTPGMFLILIGQWLFLRNKKCEQLIEKARYTQLTQLLHIPLIQKRTSQNSASKQIRNKEIQNF